MPGRLANLCHKDNEMPKMKTKSSCKKRFSMTATGKVRATQAGKQHGMIKRTNKQIRNQRGTTILTKGDADIVKGFMPYSR
jgi:large subunit ribosomal protein L35